VERRGIETRQEQESVNLNGQISQRSMTLANVSQCSTRGLNQNHVEPVETRSLQCLRNWMPFPSPGHGKGRPVSGEGACGMSHGGRLW
jgi:hypothetical protein